MGREDMEEEEEFQDTGLQVIQETMYRDAGHEEAVRQDTGMDGLWVRLGIGGAMQRSELWTGQKSDEK